MPNELLQILLDYDQSRAPLWRQMTAAKRQQAIDQLGLGAPARSPSAGGGTTSPPPAAPPAIDPRFEALLAQFQPRSPADIDALTQQRVNLAITPQRLAIERAQQQAQIANLGAQQSVQGFTQALAPALAQIGPATQQAYQQAAQTQGGLSAGFSAGLQAALQGSTQQSNQALQALGSPQQIGDQSQNAADVLYGLGGYIPGSTLNREGAAFAAAQNQLPATAIGLGQEQVGKLAHEGVVQNAEFSRDLNELMQQIPSLQADIRASLDDQNFARAQQGFDALMSIQQFAESQRQFDVGQDFNQQQFEEQIRQFDTNARLAKTQADRDFWLGRKNLALQTYSTKVNAQLAGKQFGLDVQKFGLDTAQFGESQRQFDLGYGLNAKELQLREKELNASLAQANAEARRLGTVLDVSASRALGYAIYQNGSSNPNIKVPQYNSGSTGLTPTQRRQLGGIASSIAQTAYRGGVDDEGDIPAIGYQEALNEMEKEGVPLAQAQAALNRYYKKGERGRPWLSLQQRRALANAGLPTVPENGPGLLSPRQREALRKAGLPLIK